MIVGGYVACHVSTPFCPHWANDQKSFMVVGARGSSGTCTGTGVVRKRRAFSIDSCRAALCLSVTCRGPTNRTASSGRRNSSPAPLDSGDTPCI